ncbi:MAG: type III-B CRISPR module-associated protein Cmr3 [Nitrospirota bacterium]
MTESIKTIGLRLEPLDVLFFRDGRPFTGSARNESGLPLPQTFAGAIRTHLLQAAHCNFSTMGQAINKEGKTFSAAVALSCDKEYHWIGDVAVRGPWLAYQEKEIDPLELMVQPPAILVREKRDRKKLHRLSPLQKGDLPEWNPQDNQKELRPLWLKHPERTEAMSNAYLTGRGLKRFLKGEEVCPKCDMVPQDDLFGLDYRTGIGISPDRLAAEESRIFRIGFLALKKNVFLYAEVDLPDEAPHVLFSENEPFSFGGEGRRVVIKQLDKQFEWPTPAVNTKKHLLLLTTPCPFKDGWKPQSLNGCLVSAAVPSPVAFSGWDMAIGRPKRTRFAVPAGSVYFLESDKDLVLPQTLVEDNEEGQQGWGCYLKGVWNDE